MSGHCDRVLGVPHTASDHDACERRRIDALRANAGRVTITRNEAGSLVIEGTRPDGSTAAVATYHQSDEYDWLPALRHMLATCLPGACKACGGAFEPGRTIISLQSGGWMHRNPCWVTALDEAAAQDAEDRR